MSRKRKLYETDLYEPVQSYFAGQGFTVHAEVNDCDVVAVKAEEIVIVELKLSLTTSLLTQAANRQKLTPNVYIAIPKPSYSLRRRKWRDIVHLVRRLELGLILVEFGGKIPHLQVVHEPGKFDRKRSFSQNKKHRDRLLKEVAGRKSNVNVGGSTKQKVMTAYKENCIQIAYLLDKHGPMSAKTLRTFGTGDKTHSILYKNYYGWFERVSRGVYDITSAGREEYKTYDDIVKLYAEE